MNMISFVAFGRVCDTLVQCTTTKTTTQSDRERERIRKHRSSSLCSEFCGQEHPFYDVSRLQSLVCLLACFIACSKLFIYFLESPLLFGFIVSSHRSFQSFVFHFDAYVFLLSATQRPFRFSCASMFVCVCVCYHDIHHPQSGLHKKKHKTIEGK